MSLKGSPQNSRDPCHYRPLWELFNKQTNPQTDPSPLNLERIWGVKPEQDNFPFLFLPKHKHKYTFVYLSHVTWVTEWREGSQGWEVFSLDWFHLPSRLTTISSLFPTAHLAYPTPTPVIPLALGKEGYSRHRGYFLNFKIIIAVKRALENSVYWRRGHSIR